MQVQVVSDMYYVPENNYVIVQPSVATVHNGALNVSQSLNVPQESAFICELTPKDMNMSESDDAVHTILLRPGYCLRYTYSIIRI